MDPKTQTANTNLQGLPSWAASNFEIHSLVDLYQQQVAELSNFQQTINEDQERLAEMLAPFTAPDGRIIAPPDENVLFLKQGLDLRFAEYEEECRRIQQTQRRLQRKIEDYVIEYDSMVVEAQGFAESKLLKQVREQQRIIQLQQREIDDMRLQRDVLADETRRLRQACRYGDWIADGYGQGNYSPPDTGRGGGVDMSGMAHRVNEATRQPTDGWMAKIRHAKEELFGE